MSTAVPARPQPRPNQRLLAAARTIADLQAAVPGAYREQGLPGLSELADQTNEISAQHRHLLATAAVLARSPLAGAHRAAVRPLADAAEKLGRAVGAISRAAAMAGRIHAVHGVDSPAAQQTREKAGQQLNLALSHTRLALGEAAEGLRGEARALPIPASRATARSAAALTTAIRASLPPAPAPSARAELPPPAAAASRGR
ncbi:hypothetical protein ABZW30_08175 [Kitasatospora sp. NPDC004669]|uniref:hypothetical protein n=1 Tax=Kitasatospora sp. NPDC004669 TaxID=3154555 RepID=UPI0033A2BDA4